jgi:hypothetical protein
MGIVGMGCHGTLDIVHDNEEKTGIAAKERKERKEKILGGARLLKSLAIDQRDTGLTSTDQ